MYIFMLAFLQPHGERVSETFSSIVPSTTSLTYDNKWKTGVK